MYGLTASWELLESDRRILVVIVVGSGTVVDDTEGKMIVPIQGFTPITHRYASF